MNSTTFKQELPPPKGYERIVYERIPLKNPWPIGVKVGIVIAATFGGSFFFKAEKQRIQDEQIEETACRACLMPLLTAERDRLSLRDYKKAREEEIEVMKNVPGWVPGTLWGDPVYKSIGPNDYYDPIEPEIFAHASIYQREVLRNRGRYS